VKAGGFVPSDEFVRDALGSWLDDIDSDDDYRSTGGSSCLNDLLVSEELSYLFPERCSPIRDPIGGCASRGPPLGDDLETAGLHLEAALWRAGISAPPWSWSRASSPRATRSVSPAETLVSIMGADPDPDPPQSILQAVDGRVATSTAPASCPAAPPARRRAGRAAARGPTSRTTTPFSRACRTGSGPSLPLASFYGGRRGAY